MPPLPLPLVETPEVNSDLDEFGDDGDDVALDDDDDDDGIDGGDVACASPDVVAFDVDEDDGIEFQPRSRTDAFSVR